MHLFIQVDGQTRFDGSVTKLSSEQDDNGITVRGFVNAPSVSRNGGGGQKVVEAVTSIMRQVSTNAGNPSGNGAPRKKVPAKKTTKAARTELSS
jgi:hypothetical protein